MEVDRLAYSMVGRAIDPNPMIEEPLQSTSQLFAGRIEDGEVVETGAPGAGGDPPRLSQVFSPR